MNLSIQNIGFKKVKFIVLVWEVIISAFCGAIFRVEE